jgi:Cu-Zn family superoxide dismutase
MRPVLAGLVVFSWLAAVFATGTASAQLQPTTATADVRDRLSRFIGTATLREEQGGVHVTAQLRNLAEGPHGLHIDDVGKCLSPAFLSAGGIFNPTGKQHGLRNPAGPQVGDLPSLIVGADGSATLDAMARGATLSSGATALLGRNGTALVLHRGDDDQLTDPEGNAGDRIACGVILPGDPVAASATAQSRPPAAAVQPTPAPVPVATPVAAPPVAAPPVAAPPVATPSRPVATASQPVNAPSPPASSDPRTPVGAPVVAAVLGVLLIMAGYLLRRQGGQR